MNFLECYECGSYEIRVVNVLCGTQRVYIFACAEHSKSGKGVWEPINLAQLTALTKLTVDK